jgi:hypothetical protein
MPVLRVDAHFTVVEAALKGYMKWRSAHGSKPQQDVKTHEILILLFIILSLFFFFFKVGANMM